MQIETIQAFLQICRDGAISKSCEKMNISQQGLSQQMIAMERELGVTLFIRSRQGIRLTAEGRLFRPYCEEMERQYRAGLQALRSAKEQNVIRLGFSVSAAHAVGSNFVIRYQTMHPELAVQIRSITNDGCERQLLNGELDAALLISPVHMDRLDTALVCESPSCAVMAKDHPLAKREQICLEDLAGETVFVPNREYRMRQLFEKAYGDLFPSFGRLLSSAEYMDYLKLPATSGGVALGFAAFCQNLGETLTAIPMKENFPMRIYFCTNPKSTHTTQLLGFCEFVKHTLRVHPQT